uniref:ATPase n=1 Tax=Chlorobium chlorochromatii (strain CaD3) TaxID=340177 RepID=Q3AQ70_CHLCH
MRIEHLIVKNFKGFVSKEFTFHPNFNLIVGMNGTGKTSMLDALAVAIGSWFLGFYVDSLKMRQIRHDDVLLKYIQHSWEHIYPCEVEAYGVVMDRHIKWSRELNTINGRTTYGNALAIKELALQATRSMLNGDDIILPLISYYGTGRLWQEPREAFKVSDPRKVANKETQSRRTGYFNSIEPRLSVNQLTQWIAQQSWIAYQEQGQVFPVFNTVQDAIIGCIEDAKKLYFDAKLGEVIVEFSSGTQPFSNLSDGQRCMLAMVGDIAHKAAKLNPHLGSDVLKETNGVVLIDELDLHLHPRWQRRVIEDLRNVFPKIQFICTTHSPFLIQSLRSGEELVMLDGQPFATLGNLSLEEIAHGIQQVKNPEVSLRYESMKATAKSFLTMLDEASLAPKEKLKQLADKLRPYADNPAFQAFLEMERIAKLGE